jgi:DNA-binding NtrC family response regulator
MQDNELLSERILDECCERLGVATKELTVDALDLLKSHDWPGNVRELYNVIERACIMNENATQISGKGFRDVFTNNLIRHEELRTPLAALTANQQNPWQNIGSEPKTLKEQVRETERQAITEALKQASGHRTRAAKALGISRAALYQKLESLQIN